MGWSGPSIDASEFDVVIVDTPTNIRVRNSKKVIQVVHDLIPLTDPTLDASSRNRFAAGLPHAIENYTHYLFVSDFTKRKFYSLFGSAAEESLVFYPRVAIANGSTRAQSSEKYAILVISDEPRKNIENALEAAFYFNEALRLYVVGDYDLEKFQKLARNINSPMPVR